ncbi:MAG: RNA pyrophosphohydrolase [Betaproteobacteria bacterium TMED156]|nr:MAG: RNA pyrophosphohydrolase [Betaproteobacteria bacterium TMED156]
MYIQNGYRRNIGIIIVNAKKNVFWAKRVNENAWQFPQGGIKRGETLVGAMYRELEEETGLNSSDIEILGRTKKWLYYDVPTRLIKKEWRNNYKGQKQIWFLLKLICKEKNISLGEVDDKREFDDWMWKDFVLPINEVVSFKKNVYRKALLELSTYIFSDEELKLIRHKLSL